MNKITVLILMVAGVINLYFLSQNKKTSYTVSNMKSGEQLMPTDNSFKKNILYTSATVQNSSISFHSSAKTRVTIISGTIAYLRTIKIPQKNFIYKSIDQTGGDWYFDVADNTTQDNTGTVLVTVTGKRLKRKFNGPANVDWFGAKSGDANFDNAPAITKAINACKTIMYTKGKIYTTRSTVQVTGNAGCVINATGSTIINRNYDARTFLFINCSNIKMIGGFYTRDILPAKQNDKAQSTIGFQTCKNVTVTKTHISRSPEMGIDNNIVIGGTYTYNTIENCLRDGIYAHYSANLKYIGNTLNQIKDDALSMHDYGLDNQKEMLHKTGYKQAGHSVISDNIIRNSVQGIVSIGCTDIVISKNSISNTVHAGISLFNSEDLYLNSTARVNNIRVLNNRLNNNITSIIVNGINIRPTVSGHAAIFIACNRQGQAYTTSGMRSASITVLNNVVTNSGANGIILYNIDGLNFKNNTFTNCHSDTSNSPSLSGDIVEIQNCTNIMVAANNVSDNRPVVLHNRAYVIDNSSGTFNKGVIKGFKIQDVLVKKSPVSIN